MLRLSPAVRERLTAELGPFPPFQYWGSGASIASSEWIVAAAEKVLVEDAPDLTLVYLPHLDYDLQRFGSGSPRTVLAARDIERVAGRLFDFARTVENHRKPGFEPAELFLDPDDLLVKARAALGRKRLGFRYVMGVVPLDPSHVKGTHERLPDSPRDGPVLLCSDASLGAPRPHRCDGRTGVAADPRSIMKMVLQWAWS